MSLYETDPTVKQNKKMMRTGMIAAFSGGIGLAIYLMQKMFGGIAPAENMNAMIDDVCLLLMAYMAAIFAASSFAAAYCSKLTLFCSTSSSPCVVAKLFSEYM